MRVRLHQSSLRCSPFSFPILMGYRLLLLSSRLQLGGALFCVKITRSNTHVYYLSHLQLMGCSSSFNGTCCARDVPCRLRLGENLRCSNEKMYSLKTLFLPPLRDAFGKTWLDVINNIRYASWIFDISQKGENEIPQFPHHFHNLHSGNSKTV